ncbi:hypothetical protein J6A31_03225 [bacterium]|nr:hypothetical protein [bacterium]
MSEQEILGFIVVLLLIPFISGIVCGLQNKIVVFRNYDDLWLAFLTVCAPILMFCGYVATESKILGVVFVLLELLLVSYTIHRTYIDNGRNIGSTLLALYTKIPLCGLFILQLLSYLNNQTKPAHQRTHAITTLISIILLVPLIIRLVKHKNGLFS